MLVLSRKPNEVLTLETSDGLITVTVTELLANRVKLGVEAPRNVSIHRKEVYDAIKRGEPKP